MPSFYTSVIQNFLIAFGVVIGANLFSGLGALITNHPPHKVMIEVANSIKIWAIAAFLGRMTKGMTKDGVIVILCFLNHLSAASR